MIDCTHARQLDSQRPINCLATLRVCDCQRYDSGVAGGFYGYGTYRLDEERVSRCGHRIANPAVESVQKSPTVHNGFDECHYAYRVPGRDMIRCSADNSVCSHQFYFHRTEHYELTEFAEKCALNPAYSTAKV